MKWLTAVMVSLAILVVLFRLAVKVNPPPLGETYTEQPERTEQGEEQYTCGESWLKKNRYGLWEMYLKGSDFELGVNHGILAKELIHYQEEVFVSKIRELVPSENYLRFLKYVVVWMNRNIDHYIPLEFQREIYGVALQASDEFSFIGPDYQRILNYHAAHDIGHALQNMNLVACTALAVNGNRSRSGELLVGRNFDFSMGDDFARNKIIAFYEPDSGYRFASITWGGMIGVVSGMNEKGLVVTLNAAKSGIPTSSKTPTSILARQILQYAATIEEAYEMAGQAETFVAESFLISSAQDRKTVVIEKSPKGLALYDPGTDELILTNHFQSETFRNSKLTLKNKEEGASVYRWDRAKQLLDRQGKHDEESFVKILRDRYGMDDREIGMGNERAVNQLVAHHSVVFKPEELKMWVSAFPYSLGTYLSYDLNRVFADTLGIEADQFIAGESIEADPFLSSDAFLDYQKYKLETGKIKKIIDNDQLEKADPLMLDRYLQLNPHYYYPYFLAGEVYRLEGNTVRAEEMYSLSLSKEIPRKIDRKIVTDAKERLHKR
jgi:isopenicillin-N N-acyltransferase-like protein